MAAFKNIGLLVLGFVISTGCFGKSYLREQVVGTALSQLGVYELTGNNDGEQVERYLKTVGLKKGSPWCAAFVSWCYTQHCVSNPKSGWCPSWFTKDNTLGKDERPLQGDVFGIYFKSKGRVAHVGMVLEWGDSIVLTIEGNTNDAGSREGDGVYKKRRIKNQIYKVSRWL